MRLTALASAIALCAAALPALAQNGTGHRPANPANQLCGVDGKPACDPRATAEQAINDVLPLTPELVEELRRKYSAVGRAVSGVGRPETYVTPLSQRINMSFLAGGGTPILHTEVNYPTAVSFFDNTGKPWPVQHVSNSNPDEPANRLGGFQTKVVNEGSNSIEISTRTPNARGGLVVQLYGAPRPLSFMLFAGTGQYMADAVVHAAGRGPNAALGVAVRADSVETGGRHLAEMLDGITPAGAEELGISGGSADSFRAWAMNGKVYLRTHHASLVAPQWDASSRGPDETAVYSVPEQAHGRTPLIVSDGSKNFSILASRRSATSTRR